MLRKHAGLRPRDDYADGSNFGLNKNPSTRRLRSCMTSSRAVGRCVRHRGHRDTEDTEDTEEFRDFASTTLPATDGRICCLAITAGAPRSARGLFVYTL